MNKLQMAHDWAMKHGKVDSMYNREDTVDLAWGYADAMQAKADERIKQKVMDDAKASNEFMDALTAKPSGGEWKPDWSGVLDGFDWFVVASAGGYGFFTNTEPELVGDYYFVGAYAFVAKNHGYKGEWKESLRKRPD